MINRCFSLHALRCNTLRRHQMGIYLECMMISVALDNCHHSTLAVRRALSCRRCWDKSTLITARLYPQDFSLTVSMSQDSDTSTQPTRDRAVVFPALNKDAWRSPPLSSAVRLFYCHAWRVCVQGVKNSGLMWWNRLLLLGCGVLHARWQIKYWED